MNYTNNNDLPQPFVNAVKSNHRYTPNRYSVTDVLGGTCEAVLKRRHDSDITEDVSQRIWALFGSAVHKVLQEAEATPDQLQENWLSVEIEGLTPKYELSGIFDLYDDSTGTVTDYKTCSVWKTQVGDFDDWRRQTLMYCWMLQQAGFDAWNGEVVAIMRDHSMRKAKTEKGYPKHPVMRVSWAFSEKDVREIEERIYDWFHAVHAQERLPDDGLEPCSDAQRWHRPDKWAVMKKGRKTAVRVYDNKGDAYQRAAMENRQAGKEDLYFVEFREGEDTKCESYCPVAQFCPHHKAMADSADE